MEMTSKEIFISCAFLVAFLIFIVWATFFSKQAKLKSDSMEEFALGGRGFGYFIVVCTLIGVFLPASAYTGWYSWAMYEGLIAQYIVVYSIAAFFIMYLFTQRIWIWGKNFNLLTQPDFLQLRFRSKPLSYVGAVSGLIIEAPWMIIEFASIGWLIAAVTGGVVNREIGILIAGSLVIAYTIYGGMRSVAVAEIVKGILVLVVVIIGSVLIIYKLHGGFGNMYENILAVLPQNMTFNTGGAYTYSYWNSIILTGTLGCFGWLSMFARVYTAKSVKEVKKSASGGAIFMVLISVLLYIVAVGAILIPGAADSGEMAFFFMAKEAFGPVFLGLSGVMVLAAAMGFIAVVISAHSVVITENLIKPFKQNMTENQRRKYSRITILVYGIICMIIAMQDLPNLAHIAIVAYEGVVQIIPVIIFGIFWRRANKWSGGIGYVVGLIIAIGLALYPMEIFGAWSGGVIGLVVNTIINIILGFAIKKEPYVDKLFDVVKTYKENAKGEQIVTEDSVEALNVACDLKAQ
jgi:SSS family solute:Na+ symporter